MNLYHFHKVSRFFHKLGLKPISKIIYHLSFLVFNSIVPPDVQIGKGSRFAYGGIGVVIGKKVKIGDYCVIGQGVTLGGRGKNRPGTIVLGDYVYIGAGARILGPVTIGDYSIVAPNAVVHEDVPPGTIVGGIPAKKIGDGVNLTNRELYI